MKPQEKLAEAKAPDGVRLTLHSHDGHFVVRADGQALMHSALSASEEQLGALSAAAAKGRKAARVLLGGLGLGFTLRRVLEGLEPDGVVTVAELFPEVVEWNRSFLCGLNGNCLDDSRVVTRVGDVATALGRGIWDVISLDVDNGPAAMVRAGNSALYGEKGLARLAGALRAGGSLLVWSAGPDAGFARRLEKAGFVNVRAESARTHAGARSRGYVIFVAERAA